MLETENFFRAFGSYFLGDIRVASASTLSDQDENKVVKTLPFT